MSNMTKANRRVSVVLGLIALCTIAALLGIYPTNYESLFTPINIGLYAIIWISIAVVIGCLFSKYRLPGNDGVPTVSFIHMMATLGLACGFFSYVVDPSFIAKYGVGDPYKQLINWYGPFQWVIFVPFMLMEIWEEQRGFPNWLVTIKRYVYAVSMMLAIGISLMAGCNSIPKIIYSLFQFEVSPYLLMLPICLLVSISLIRGVHKGMQMFSNLTMVLMYVITASFVILGLSAALPGYVGKEVFDTYSQFITLNTYTGTKFQIEQSAPFFIWMFTWIPIMSPFAKRIGQGRKLRTVTLLMVFGPSLICAIYAAIGSYVFPMFGGGIELLSKYAVLGVLYVIMLLMMFVTSADSTSYSLDELISRGVKAPISYRKLLWVIVMCGFITILMIAGGDSTDALYGISYITAPMIAILGIIMGGIMVYKTIRKK